MSIKSHLTAALLAAGCAPHVTSIGPDHPANPEAEPGRLAGPPAALRVGVALLEEPPPQPRGPAHDHRAHSHDGSPASVGEKSDAPQGNSTPAPVDGAHLHGADTARPANEKPAPAREKPAPAPEKPAQAPPPAPPPGHEGHH